MKELTGSLYIAGVVAIGRTNQALLPIMEHKQLVKSALWIAKTTLFIATKGGVLVK